MSRGPDQNILQDDPAFLLGDDLLNLNDILDLEPLMDPGQGFRDESLITLNSSLYNSRSSSTQRSRHTAASHALLASTQIQDDSSVGFGDIDSQLPGIDEVEQLEEVDYEFGEDGSMRNIIPIRKRENNSLLSPAAGTKRPGVKPRAPRQGRERLASDDLAIAQVQREHAEALDQAIEVSYLSWNNC